MDNFLASHAASDKSVCTHTRIGSPAQNIYGGSYCITDKSEFFKVYYRHIFENHQLEYLTEKQFDVGPVGIDIDFRYKTAKRAYTSNDILEFIDISVQQLNLLFTVNETFPIYVFEKKDINALPDKIKDGIHLIIGINMDKTAKELFRKKILDKIDVWNHLLEHLTNTWDSVLDNGVFKGNTGWQLYGSTKPGCEAYKLTKIYMCQKDEDSEYVLHSTSLDTFDMRKNLYKLSIQNIEYETPVLKDAFKPEYDQLKQSPRKKLRVVSNDGYNDITCAASLTRAVTNMLSSKSISDYKLHETHAYTMILPASYYDDYDKWIKVGWALRNTDVRLFVTWIKFSSQADAFSYSEVPKFFGMWCSWAKPNVELTDRSIMFWARNEAPVEYEKVKEKSIDVYIDAILKDICTEYDLAKILYQWYKDRFVCVSINHKCWFEYSEQRWKETDSGTKLRTNISDFSGIYGLFTKKLKSLNDELSAIPDEKTEQKEILQKRHKKLCTIMIDLKKTDKKANIMREACDLFYIKDFMTMLDSKNHILCFSNGVIDFETSKFRDGLPDDYTSKCTNIPYVKLDASNKSIVAEIVEFMEQLFPEPELREYMWDHAASTLIGKNDNQTFNMYTGEGRNGKSKFVQLMSMCLGEYKATVPITLITQKRTGIGSISPEIVQLMGIRYAVMQEPSVGDQINEGILKELTGGDPIQGRALYKDTITFYPQFKLVVCTNTDLDIKSTDDGTWRRIRKCAFKSVFNENPVQNDVNKPFQFKVDKNIDSKFEKWKTVFISMLVERAIKTKGEVKECAIVMAVSENYRKNQDHFSEFLKDRIMRNPEGSINDVELYETFKEWWTLFQGRNVPKGKQLFDYINKTFGNKVGRGWKGISIIKDDVEEISEL
jgi:P4 family phage/plasmid primase-like protien